MEKIGYALDERVQLTLEEFYSRCKNLKTGGWCGLNAEYLRLVLAGFGLRCWPYNYGILQNELTHVCLVVELDGIRFLLDPYFNRVYRYRGDFYLSFDDLIRLVQERKFGVITSSYGKGKKMVQTDGGNFVSKLGHVLESDVMEAFRMHGFEKIATSVFGTPNPLLLMLIKIPEPPK